MLAVDQAVDVRDRTPIAHVIYSESPGEAIAAFVVEHGFDLLVVGAHGSDQVMHRGVGRALETLIRSHPCPILVV